eukprot:TRINITY_DN6399_c0_g1_i1.p1 TRINITY_DN6399_c0_g1~~TRINITY_DN6399_c0_g1_i1.p1  ORF type:complete len:270 (+),score=75.50 TRINITY_DN6399_c0_g1_i1:61-810(+)
MCIRDSSGFASAFQKFDFQSKPSSNDNFEKASASAGMSKGRKDSAYESGNRKPAANDIQLRDFLSNDRAPPKSYQFADFGEFANFDKQKNDKPSATVKTTEAQAKSPPVDLLEVNDHGKNQKGGFVDLLETPESKQFDFFGVQPQQNDKPALKGDLSHMIFSGYVNAGSQLPQQLSTSQQIPQQGAFNVNQMNGQAFNGAGAVNANKSNETTSRAVANNDPFDFSQYVVTPGNQNAKNGGKTSSFDVFS